MLSRDADCLRLATGHPSDAARWCCGLRRVLDGARTRPFALSAFGPAPAESLPGVSVASSTSIKPSEKGWSDAGRDFGFSCVVEA